MGIVLAIARGSLGYAQEAIAIMHTFNALSCGSSVLILESSSMRTERLIDYEESFHKCGQKPLGPVAIRI